MQRLRANCYTDYPSVLPGPTRPLLARRSCIRPYWFCLMLPWFWCTFGMRIRVCASRTIHDMCIYDNVEKNEMNEGFELRICVTFQWMIFSPKLNCHLRRKVHFSLSNRIGPILFRIEIKTRYYLFPRDGIRERWKNLSLYTDPMSTANFKIHCRKNDKREIHSGTE